MEIKWTDDDDETGERRFIKADRFAGFWKFHVRIKRRGEWVRLHPTIEMWKEVLDSMERRYRRREGVTEDDLKQVRRIIAELRAKGHGEEEE